MSTILDHIDDTLANWHGSVDAMHWQPDGEDECAPAKPVCDFHASPQIWFDRQGQPIDATTANGLLGDSSYTRVALTRIVSRADRSLDWRVSTVWLGVNYNWFGGEPILFETMVLGYGAELGQWRWTTEAAARIGHAEVVATLRRQVSRARVEDCDRWYGPSFLDARYRQRQKNRRRR